MGGFELSNRTAPSEYELALREEEGHEIASEAPVEQLPEALLVLLEKFDHEGLHGMTSEEVDALDEAVDLKIIPQSRLLKEQSDAA